MAQFWWFLLGFASGIVVVNEWCEKVIDSPVPDMPRDCSHFRQKTNGDLIRAMSDEELGKFLCGLTECRPETCHGADTCKPGRNGLVEWLKQPVEVE